MNPQQRHFDANTTRWFKATHSSGDNNCLETARVPHLVPVRDSKTPEGPILLFSTATWDRFITELKSGG
ncbi:DUF397 domain-containing protein [Streptomyces kunmingensis]|uniref:DUF397 domain-containing protein n=1 Tax=Streptomyces kunmingensis TaxID=68225 RepID=A0ABU6C960_9ACTN|nr:DUF397 domain-containing protein [Streptomyces kunmingensis]MEB3961252.1 DUF397 domain-containing protein [Streptomyces kunmingensis]